MPETRFSEAHFASALDAWVGQLAYSPLFQYRGVYTLDAGYLPLYFRVLDAVRRATDVQLPASPGERLTKIERLRSAAQRFRSMMAPAAAPAPFKDRRRTALVVRAAPNPTGFPVLRTLIAQYGWHVLFAAWNRKLESRVRSLGVDFHHLGSSYSRKLATARRRHRPQLSTVLTHAEVARLETSFFEFTAAPPPPTLIAILRDVCTEVRSEVDVYAELLDRVSPSLLILFNEVSLRERTAAKVAREMGIRSVSIQHGLYLGYVYRSLATDRVIVWGDVPKQFWIDRGCEPVRISAVGGFGHESWDWPARRASRADSDARVLVLGQNPAAFISPALYRDTLAAVLGAAERMPTVRFIIRPHPGESTTFYEEALRERGLANVTIESYGEVQYAILKSDVVLTVFSTAGLEALLLGVPVVVLNPSSDPPLAPYAQVSPVAFTKESLVAAVQPLLRDERHRERIVREQRAFAHAYFGPLDGGASERAARAIDEFAS